MLPQQRPIDLLPTDIKIKPRRDHHLTVHNQIRVSVNTQSLQRVAGLNPVGAIWPYEDEVIGCGLLDCRVAACVAVTAGLEVSECHEMGWG
jgi:hypothetical protein